MTLYELFDCARSWMGIHGREDLAWSVKCLSIDPDSLTPKQLLSEMSFAILASGFRVATIQKRWSDFTRIFLNWDPVDIWYACTVKVDGPATFRYPIEGMKEKALMLLNNEMKIKCIIINAQRLARIVIGEDGSSDDWIDFRGAIYEDVNVLKRFAYIGDTLKYHVARNIGVDTIKPDVHITRIAKHYGYDPFEMAEMLSEQFTIPKHTVDTILWRYGERGLVEEFWREHNR